MQPLTSEQQKKLLRMAKVMDDGDIALLAELDTLEKRVEDVESVATQAINVATEKQVRGEDGIDGKDGVDGVNGVDGRDGLDGRDGVDGKDGKDGRDGIDGKDGTDGRDGNIKDLSPQEVRDSLELLEGDERLNASAISGLDKEVTDRAISIVDNRTSYLINRINNLPTTSGASTFTALTDVPNSYIGQATKAVRVNAGETALEFFTISAGGGDVVGPVSAVDSNFASFNTTTGKLIKDSGSRASDFATAAQGSKADNAVVANGAITGATKTKITYDAKGLVTSGADATTADIADSTNKRYVTDAQLTVIGNTSGTNSGDNAVNSNYSGLVSNATHTGDATGSTALTVKGINGTLLSGLTTGILKNTTTTGVPSIAVNSDLTVMSATVGGAVPTPPNVATQYLNGQGSWTIPFGDPYIPTANIVLQDGYISTMYGKYELNGSYSLEIQGTGRLVLTK